MMQWFIKHKNWLLMSLSLLFGGGAAFSISQHLDHKSRELESKSHVPHVKRIVAAHDLAQMSVIKIEDLAMQDFPTRWITADAIAVDQVESLIGKQLNVALKAGQLLHWANTSDKSTLALSERLPVGKQAITIPVDQINSLSGLLSPADFIDLYVSFEHQGNRVTAQLLTGIEVLATGQDLNIHDATKAGRQGTFTTLTLATSPDDAVKLVAARQTGTITAVLSQSQNASSSRTNSRTRGHLAGLLGLETPQPIAVPILYGDQMPNDALQAIAAQLGAPFAQDAPSTP